jgi:hypothetical protein
MPEVTTTADHLPPELRQLTATAIEVRTRGSAGDDGVGDVAGIVEEVAGTVDDVPRDAVDAVSAWRRTD